MDKIYFSLVVHNHQPVGNFHHIFEKHYHRCYSPLLELLKKYPQIKVSIHWSGCLLEWIEKEHPDFFDKISYLLERKQIEILSGGFYEPIFSAISGEDAEEQIRMMNSYLKKHFNFIPAGLWLPERVWEPHLPSLISSSGLKYTLVDENHFYYAGLKEEEIFDYYLTENEGKIIYLFPISKKLRYIIPFGLPGDVINYFEEIFSKYGKLGITLGDDGEKFGGWPGTYQWVWEEKYLEKLFEILIKRDDLVETFLLSDFLNKVPPRGTVYIPTASYEEMGEWTLPSDMLSYYKKAKEVLIREDPTCNLAKFVRGGMWRNFLVKYPESQKMRGKMFYLSKKANNLFPKHREIKREILRGQCNCAYWYGIFGGIYLPHLRHSIYSSLLSAEVKMDKMLYSEDNWCELKKVDYDLDGEEELLLSSARSNVYIDVNYNATISEIDFKPAHFNLTNTFSRKKQYFSEEESEKKEEKTLSSIHEKIPARKDLLSEAKHFDKYLRQSFIDHFFREDITLENFMKSSEDYINEKFKVSSIIKRKNKIGAKLKGEREIKGKKISIEKSFTLNSVGNISFMAKIKNEDKDIDLWYGLELNFNFLSEKDKQKYCTIDKHREKIYLDTILEKDMVREVGLINEVNKFKIIANFSPTFSFWMFPLYTVYLTEDDYEKCYQGTVIVPSWKFKLSAGEERKIKINLKFIDI